MATPTLAQATAAPAPNRPSRRRWWSEVGWRYVVAAVAIVYAVWPIVYIISASLSERGTLTGSNQLFREVSTNNYAGLADTYFWTWLGNTLFIGTATAAGTVLMGAAAAYAFSRFRFRGRRTSLGDDPAAGAHRSPRWWPETFAPWPARLPGCSCRRRPAD